MAELYREEFGDADGRIPARFDLVTLTGWAPDASQPKPLKPGSARTQPCQSPRHTAPGRRLKVI